MKDPAALVSLLVAVAAAAIIFFLPFGHREKLELAAGYALLILIFFYGMVVLSKMMTGAIDLKLLLGESGGGASMSRFQLLIFTFVIGLSFFFVVTSNTEAKFPDIPQSVLALLGISATTYGVSKGIQASSGLQSKETAPGPAPAPQQPKAPLNP
jgi:hypothetical protein